MPSWHEVVNEYARRSGADSERGLSHIDDMRREALARVSLLTKRPVVLYATRWMQGSTRPDLTSISIDDVHAFMVVLQGLHGPDLDLILHSDGGSPTAAEAVVNYIRTRFSGTIRVFVPLAAMSAATLMACAANEIVMGKHSYLGPTDPQVILQTPLGVRMVAVHSIKKQFELAQAASSTPAFPAWIPMLQQFGPDLIVQSENALGLTKQLAQNWLERWMFQGRSDAPALAKSAADQLNSHSDHFDHFDHGRFLPREQIRKFGLLVGDLEAQQELQDAVLTVLHTVIAGFTLADGAHKLVENQDGVAIVRLSPPRAVTS